MSADDPDAGELLSQIARDSRSPYLRLLKKYELAVNALEQAGRTRDQWEENFFRVMAVAQEHEKAVTRLMEKYSAVEDRIEELKQQGVW